MSQIWLTIDDHGPSLGVSSGEPFSNAAWILRGQWSQSLQEEIERRLNLVVPQFDSGSKMVPEFAELPLDMGNRA